MLKHKSVVQNQIVEVLSGEDVLHNKGKLCVPDVGDLRKHILVEAHNSRYSIHPCPTKTYRDVREVYWSIGIKRDIVDFGSKSETMGYDSRD